MVSTQEIVKNFTEEIVKQFTQKIKLKDDTTLSDDEAKQILRSLGMKIIRNPGCNLVDVEPLELKFIAQAVSPLFKLVQHSKSSEVTLKEGKMDVMLSEVTDGMFGVSTSQKMSELKKDPEFESKKEEYIEQLKRIAKTLCSDFSSKTNIIFFPFRYLENMYSDTVVIESQDVYAKQIKLNKQTKDARTSGVIPVSNLTNEIPNLTNEIPNSIDMTNATADISNLTVDISNVTADMTNATVDISNVTAGIPDDQFSTMPKVGGRKVPKKVYRSKTRRRRSNHKGGKRKSRRFKRIN